jgi:carboxymethylenebutenolidase
MPHAPQPIVALYDAFTHGHVDRRAFMERIAVIAGGVIAAPAILPLLASHEAKAQTVRPDDPRIVEHDFTWATPDSIAFGYLVQPRQPARRPSVIVVHESRGLNPHIRDVTRRFAIEGFLALGIDALSPLGGTPGNEEMARERIGALDWNQVATWAAAAVPALAAHRNSNGRVGAVGFCWGGHMVNEVAARVPTLAAGVAYYGRQVEAARVPGIRAALMLHYADQDLAINTGIAAYEAALRGAGKTFEIHRYPGTQHAFNNDTSAARYDAAAAALAWGRTIAWLRRHLAA